MPAQPFLFPRGKHSKKTPKNPKKRQKRQIRIFTKRGENPVWKTRRFHLQSSEEHPKPWHPKSWHPKNTSQEPEPGHRGCCGNGGKAPEQDGPCGVRAGNSRARAAAVGSVICLSSWIYPALALSKSPQPLSSGIWDSSSSPGALWARGQLGS